MQAANIPHNVLIADCGSRVFIWPQAYAERQAKGLVPEELLDCGVNPAVWEISGHMVLKRAEVCEACRACWVGGWVGMGSGVGVVCARRRGVPCVAVPAMGADLPVLHTPHRNTVTDCIVHYMTRGGFDEAKTLHRR
jgi:hypothetical protein